MTMSIEDVVITCCNHECGISFAVPSWWARGKRETHTSFYCPNGHKQSYTAETSAEKMRRERDNAKQQLARAEQEAQEARILAAKSVHAKELAEAATKRLEKRASAGTCPCCQRTFANMTRHMKQKHPAFSAKPVVVPIRKASA